jgi:hypothetical protein
MFSVMFLKSPNLRSIQQGSSVALWSLLCEQSALFMAYNSYWWIKAPSRLPNPPFPMLLVSQLGLRLPGTWRHVGPHLPDYLAPYLTTVPQSECLPRWRPQMSEKLTVNCDHLKLIDSYYFKALSWGQSAPAMLYSPGTLFFICFCYSFLLETE